MGQRLISILDANLEYCIEYHFCWYINLFILPLCRDLSVENLSFLNSEQALADLAHFRQFMAMKMNLTTNKWISFGGSYPGKYSSVMTNTEFECSSCPYAKCE